MRLADQAEGRAEGGWKARVKWGGSCCGEGTGARTRCARSLFVVPPGAQLSLDSPFLLREFSP